MRWMPWDLHSHLLNFLQLLFSQNSDDAPSLIVIGSGLHYIKNFNDSADALHDYASNITKFAKVL